VTLTEPNAARWRMLRTPLVFSAVFVLWAVGFVLMAGGREPYPALIQPGFGYVADKGKDITWVEIRYVVTYADGSSQGVTYTDLLPDAGEKAGYIALTLLDGDRVDQPDVRAWLRDRVDRLGLGSDPVRLTEQRVTVTLDGDSLEKTYGTPVTSADVDLSDG